MVNELLSAEKLEQLATSLEESYRLARPFPHVVIDDLLPISVARALVGEFPAPGAVNWFAYDSETERKLEFTDDRRMGPVTREVLVDLNSSLFLGFLERLTGIEGLVPDPHLEGGGLHQIEPGGYLEVHAD